MSNLILDLMRPRRRTLKRFKRVLNEPAGIGRPSDKPVSTTGFPAALKVHREGAAMDERNVRGVELDPMQEPYWDLPMVLAWIIWRNPQAVKEQWRKFRGQLNVSGNFTRPELDDHQLGVIYDRNNGGQPPLVQPATAIADLTASMAGGRLTSYGYHSATESRSISGYEWSTCSMGSDYGLKKDGATIYTDVKVPRAEVVNEFPAPFVDGKETAPQAPEPDEAGLTPGEKRLRGAIAEIWPDGVLPGKAADRDRMIQDSYRARGETPPSVKSIQRYRRKAERS